MANPDGGVDTIPGVLRGEGALTPGLRRGRLSQPGGLGPSLSRKRERGVVGPARDSNPRAKAWPAGDPQ